MIVKNPKTLNDVQDAVFANPSYQPSANGLTFCNEATQDVLRSLGYPDLDDLMADDMYAAILSSHDWLVKPMGDCQDLVNGGTIIVAILPSYKLLQPHGHVNTLTTGKTIGSGHWNVPNVPMCMNLGRAGACFRKNGVNYAFQPIPEFYALIETL